MTSSDIHIDVICQITLPNHFRLQSGATSHNNNNNHKNNKNNSKVKLKSKMSVRICSAYRAIPLPPMTGKPRTLNTTHLLLSTSPISIRKKPLSVPLSEKRLTAASSHSRRPAPISPKRHYIYMDDSTKNGPLKIESDWAHTNTRDILSIMAIQDLRHQIQRRQHEITNFARFIENQSCPGIKIGDNGKLSTEDRIGEQSRDVSDHEEGNKPGSDGKLDEEDKFIKMEDDTGAGSESGVDSRVPVPLAK